MGDIRKAVKVLEGRCGMPGCLNSRRKGWELCVFHDTQLHKEMDDWTFEQQLRNRGLDALADYEADLQADNEVLSADPEYR